MTVGGLLSEAELQYGRRRQVEGGGDSEVGVSSEGDGGSERGGGSKVDGFIAEAQQ